MKPDDRVVYRLDPLLYGEMLVQEIKKEAHYTRPSKQHAIHKVKYIVCLVNPDEPWHRRSEEIFLPDVLELAENFYNKKTTTP